MNRHGPLGYAARKTNRRRIRTIVGRRRRLKPTAVATKPELN
jgi:hypothetical protein